MAFNTDPGQILERVAAAVEADLDRNWVAEPPAARAALLAREELERWTRSTWPGCSSEGAALDPDSRRRLSLLIHSAPASHRVEVWGSAPGDSDPPLAKGPHTSHSWVVLVHLGTGRDRELALRIGQLSSFGLKVVSMLTTPKVTVVLGMGSGAPDGCPDCLGSKP